MTREDERRARIKAATRLYDEGERRQAVHALLECLNLFNKDEEMSREYAVTCSNLASALAETGNYKVALQFFSTALKIHEASGDNQDAALVRFNMGNVYKYINNWNGALNNYEAALEGFRKCGNRERQSVCLLSIAHFKAGLGLFDEAGRHLEELVELEAFAVPLTRWSMLMLRSKLVLRKGFPEEALVHAEDALEVAGQYLNKIYVRETRFRVLACLAELGRYEQAAKHADTLNLLEEMEHDRQGLDQAASLGEIYLQSGDRARALEAYQLALRYIDEKRVQLDGSEKLLFMERYAECGRRVVAILLEDGQPESAFEMSERVQARSTLDLMFLHQIKRQEGRSVIIGPDRRIYLVPPTLPDIKAFLAREAVHMIKLFFCSKDRLAGWFLSPDGEMISWDASPAVPVLHAVLEALPTSSYLDHPSSVVSMEQIQKGEIGEHPEPGKRPLTNWTKVRNYLVDLYGLLFPAAVRRVLDKEEGHLLFIPHMELFALPFSALGSGPDHLLADGWSIGSVPSASIALQLDRARDVHQAEKSRGDLVVELIGACGPKVVVQPFFPKGMGADDQDKHIVLPFSDLPGASEELERINVVFGGTVRAGKEASSSNAMRAIASADIVHFATHGLWDPMIPERSFLLFSDGILSTREIVNLPSTAELISLAGCQTGLGRGMPDSHISLPQSLLIAGARCILVSLWPLPDKPAAVFMEKVYEYLGQSLSPADALRKAQTELRGSSLRWSLEMLWAAFQLVGWPFDPLFGERSRKQYGGPAFCGGDITVDDRHGSLLSLEDYRDFFQEPHMGVLIRGGKIVPIPKSETPGHPLA